MTCLLSLQDINDQINQDHKNAITSTMKALHHEVAVLEFAARGGKSGGSLTTVEQTADFLGGF